MMMEVEQGGGEGLAPEVELQAQLAEGNYSRALQLVEDIELEINGQEWNAQTRGDPEFYASIQMALYLIARDVNNARHLWRRCHDGFKTPGSPLSALWTVGKHLWNREIPEAYAALRVPWSPELEALTKKLRERIQQDELDLIQRAFRRIKLASMAERLGTDLAGALEVVKQQGWKVVESEGVVEPVSKQHDQLAAPPRDKVGLPQLDKLFTYVSFLEQKRITSKAS